MLDGLLVIGAQVIIGDLEEPFLEAALKSVAWVDYVVVITTACASGEGMRNRVICRETVPVGKLFMEAMPGDFCQDFAAARNLALTRVPDGDFVLILDADEVHYPEWKDICGYYLAKGADSITAAFYHFVVYRDAVQAVFPREIVFRKTPETQFVGRVHERLHTPRRNPVEADYRYCHFGYLRGQANVFERWRRYSVIEGEPHHYDGQSPEHIIDDRVSVATRFTLDYPPAVQNVIERYPVCPVPLQGEGEIASPKVGLVALWTDEDKPLMKTMLETLGETWGQYELYTVHVAPGDSLARALNKGFHEALAAGCEYIGWIHPDMRFEHQWWLSGLLHELRCWPKVGKVCAANTRDQLPEDMIDGHEQCYLIRASVLREIGLFDEGYEGIGGYEDWDMNRRCLTAGYRVVITPRAQVFHEGMATRSRRDTTAEQVANAAYYERKWGTVQCPV
jgi:hypothetical protein